jgi:hypothetical protein
MISPTSAMLEFQTCCQKSVPCITSNALPFFDVARKPGVRRALINKRIIFLDPSALQRATNQHVDLVPRALAWPFAHGRAQHVSTLKPHIVTKHDNDALLFKSYCNQMLIVHPSSSCDVCLDAYDWDIPTQMPHAIPCGHIFCKTLVLPQLKGYNLWFSRILMQ